MTARHQQPERDTQSPFIVRARGAWLSWITVCGMVSGAFAAGVWATNLQDAQKNMSSEIVELKQSVKLMEADVAWLVREQGGNPHGKAIANNP